MILPVVAALVFCASHIAYGQDVNRDSELPAGPDSLHRFERLNGGVVTRVFAETIDEGMQSVFVLEGDDGEMVAMAAAISNDGFLISKASEVRLGEENFLLARKHGGKKKDGIPVRRIDADKMNDLVLLKIEEETVPLDWGESKDKRSGYWVSSPADSSGAIRVGIIGAPIRSIKRESGYMGVMLSREGRPVVIRVFEGSGASDAGIENGDVIVSVSGNETNSTEKVNNILGSFDVGDVVRVQIERKSEETTETIELNVSLTRREDLGRPPHEEDANDEGTNHRRAGFTAVVQHDIPLEPNAMGSPLFTIDGKAIGINIARHDRVTTFALPAEIVRKIAAKMMAKNVVEEPGDDEITEESSSGPGNENSESVE